MEQAHLLGGSGAGPLARADESQGAGEPSGHRPHARRPPSRAVAKTRPHPSGLSTAESIAECPPRRDASASVSSASVAAVYGSVSSVGAGSPRSAQTFPSCRYMAAALGQPA